MIGFAPEGPPKWCFGVILGIGAKIFSGKVHLSLELHVFKHVWSRSDALYVVSDAFCMGIAISIAIGKNLGKLP